MNEKKRSKVARKVLTSEAEFFLEVITLWVIILVILSVAKPNDLGF